MDTTDFDRNFSSNFTSWKTNGVAIEHNYGIEMTLPYLKIYISPCVAVAGIIGNVLSCLVLLGSKLRTFSSSHYLVSLYMANSFYLVDYLLKWLIIHDYDIQGQPEFCQVMNLLENVSVFLSNWFMVTYCVDRYICNAWPMDAARMCSFIRARVVIVCVIIVALILHFNMSITMAVTEYGQLRKSRCMVQRHSLVNPRLKTAVELIFNIVVPYLCLLLIVALLVYHTCTQRRDVYSDDSNCAPLQRTTKVLLSTYVIMHVPYEFYRIVFITKGVTQAHPARPSHLEFIVQAFLNHWFRFGMAIHLIILLGTYPLFRTYCKQFAIAKFRKVLGMCRCIEHKKNNGRSIEIEMTCTEVTGQTGKDAIAV